MMELSLDRVLASMACVCVFVSIASDISADRISIIRKIRLRNSMMKSSNLAVDKQTSFSIYQQQKKKNNGLLFESRMKFNFTSVRSFRIVTADEQSTQVIMIRIVSRNSSVAEVFTVSFKSIAGRTDMSNGKT